MQPGQTLTASVGRWSNEPASFAYQWQRCEGFYRYSCSPIAWATGATYVLTEAEVGHRISVLVSATNDGGTGGPVASEETGVVTALPLEARMRAVAAFFPEALPRLSPITLGLGFRSKALNRHSVPELDRIDIEVSKSVVLNKNRLPSCAESILFSNPARTKVSCAGSLVGHGKVVSEVTLPGKSPAMLNGHLLAFYNSTGGHRGILAQVSGGNALPLTYVIPFRFASPQNGFGSSLYVNKSRMRHIHGKCKSDNPNCFGSYGFEGICTATSQNSN